jgi:hypothetical protein
MAGLTLNIYSRVCCPKLIVRSSLLLPSDVPPGRHTMTRPLLPQSLHIRQGSYGCCSHSVIGASTPTLMLNVEEGSRASKPDAAHKFQQKCSNLHEQLRYKSSSGPYIYEDLHLRMPMSSSKCHPLPYAKK